MKENFHGFLILWHFFTIYNFLSYVFSVDPHNYPGKQAGEGYPTILIYETNLHVR